jgi:hypothetical protein
MLIEAVYLYDKFLVYELHPLYPLFFNYPYLTNRLGFGFWTHMNPRKNVLRRLRASKALMMIFASEGFSVLRFWTSLHRIGRKTPSDCEIILIQ